MSTKKKILLTNARGPLTLDLARSFSTDGYDVYVIDSQKNPLIEKSIFIKKLIHVPAPRQEREHYLNKIIEIISTYQIDLIFPIYEETFTISYLKNKLEKYCQVFVEDFSTLEKLHHKYQFNLMCKDIGLSVPESKIIHDKEEAQLFWKERNYVLKKVYSRFASDIRFSAIDSLPEKYEESNPWMLQDKIHGQEYCSSSLCYKGKLLAHVVYHHEFKAGKGAGISFECVDHPKIYQWIQKFLQHTSFTGQLCFDFIDDGHQVYALECNPRATSGFHLLTQLPDFSKSLLDYENELITPQEGEISYLSKMALVIYGIPALFSLKKIKAFIKILKKGRNILGTYKDENYNIKQLSTIIYFYFLSRKHQITLLEATTYDIEWNG